MFQGHCTIFQETQFLFWKTVQLFSRLSRMHRNPVVVYPSILQLIISDVYLCVCGPAHRPTQKQQVRAVAVAGSWALHGRGWRKQTRTWRSFGRNGWSSNRGSAGSGLALHWGLPFCAVSLHPLMQKMCLMGRENPEYLDVFHSLKGHIYSFACTPLKGVSHGGFSFKVTLSEELKVLKSLHSAATHWVWVVYLEVCRYLWETGQRLSVSWLAWAVPSSLLCAWPVLPALPLCGCLVRINTVRHTGEVDRKKMDHLLLLRGIYLMFYVEMHLLIGWTSGLTFALLARQSDYKQLEDIFTCTCGLFTNKSERKCWPCGCITLSQRNINLCKKNAFFWVMQVLKILLIE